jgi:hypothetical protein
VNVSCVERLVAGGAGDDRVGPVAAGGVVEDDGGAVATDRPAVAPGGDGEEDVAELPAFVREEVVVADGLVGVWAAFDDAVVEEMVEPLGEDLAGDAEVALELVEAADADEEVSKDERRLSMMNLAHVDRPRRKREMTRDLLTLPKGMLDSPRTRMARIALTPTWADLVDFQRRLPDALGGIRPEAEPS